MLININSVMLRLLLLWFFISSVYYLDAIFIGVEVLKNEENIYHKIIKYSVSLFLTFSILLWQKKILVFIVAVLFLLLAIVSVIDFGGVTIFATTMLIIATMIGYIYIIPTFYNQIEKINYALMWTGVIVGGISVLEIMVFYQNMASYWAATGGVRSISSLLNPTNSGAYSAVMIILAITTKVKSSVLKILFIVMPLITLVFSGSRTAWLSLGLVMCLTLFLRDRASQNIRKFIPFMLILGIASVILYINFSDNVFSEIDSKYRGFSAYTVSIRIENFLSYFYNINIDMLLPDMNDKNINLIADNFYLVILNFFGIIGFTILFIFIVIFLFLNSYSNEVRHYIPSEVTSWKIIFLYFIVSGLSNSFINSFPVNQLFFLSCGYFIYKAKIHNLLSVKEDKDAII